MEEMYQAVCRVWQSGWCNAVACESWLLSLTVGYGIRPPIIRPLNSHFPTIYIQQRLAQKCATWSLDTHTVTSLSNPPNPPTMLDDFSIVTTSGIVLWRRSYAPVSSNLVNSLINDVFVEERQKSAAQETALNPPYRKDKYTLKWTAAKDVGLVFVVGKSACDNNSTSLHIDNCLCRPYTKVFSTCPGLTTC